MQVTVETPTAVERRVRVEIPEARVTGEVDKRLSDLAQSVRMPGFRPGKVPVKVIRQRYGRQVREEVVGEIVQSSLGDAIAQEKLQPASAPTIDPLEFAPGQGVAYTATFDVFPPVNLPPLSSLEISRPVAEVEDADLDRMLETLRRQRITWEEVDRAAASGDRVVVDFEGTVDGEPIEQGRGDEVTIEIGAGRMIPGFEEGLIGGSADVELTLELTFPEDYPSEELAGRPSVFRVKVRKVEQSVLPELDEAFAESYGVVEGAMETFRCDVRGNMERELQDGLRALTKLRVMDALLAGERFEVPRSSVDKEIERAMNQRKLELTHSGLDPEQLGLEPSMFEEQASRRVSLGLLLGEVIKIHDIQVDTERVRERIETIASTYEDANEVISWYYSDRERLSEVESTVLEDQVVEWILERAEVSDDSTSFDEVLKPGQTRLPPRP